jgi:hypothetical protein
MVITAIAIKDMATNRKSKRKKKKSKNRKGVSSKEIAECRWNN